MKLDKGLLFQIANKLYKPSYVSLQTALAYHQLIPETIYGVTSVSTRRTYRFDTSVGHFLYRTVTKRMYFGFTVMSHATKIASMEKALLDFFYLNPQIKSEEAFAALRLDREALLDQLDISTLNLQLQRFKKETLISRVHHFLDWIHHA